MITQVLTQAGTRKKGVWFPLERKTAVASVRQQGGTHGKSSAWHKTRLRCPGSRAESPRTEEDGARAFSTEFWRRFPLSRTSLPRLHRRNKGCSGLCGCPPPSCPERRAFLCFVSSLKLTGCSASDETCLGNRLPREGWVTQPGTRLVPALCRSSSPSHRARAASEPAPLTHRAGSPLSSSTAWIQWICRPQAPSPALAIQSPTPRGIKAGEPPGSSEINSLAVVWIATAFPSHGNGIPSCQQVPMKPF